MPSLPRDGQAVTTTAPSSSLATKASRTLSTSPALSRQDIPAGADPIELRLDGVKQFGNVLVLVDQDGLVLGSPRTSTRPGASRPAGIRPRAGSPGEKLRTVRLKAFLKCRTVRPFRTRGQWGRGCAGLDLVCLLTKAA